MEIFSFDEVKEHVYGKVGTPKRDAYEERVRKALQEDRDRVTFRAKALEEQKSLRLGDEEE